MGTDESCGYLNVKGAAEYLGVSQFTISRWLASGRLPATRIGERIVRIQREDLDALVRTTGSKSVS